jgi:hypothetical protein
MKETQPQRLTLVPAGNGFILEEVRPLYGEERVFISSVSGGHLEEQVRESCEDHLSRTVYRDMDSLMEFLKDWILVNGGEAFE